MNEIDELKNSIVIPDELDLAIRDGIERGKKEKDKNVKSRKNKIIKKFGLVAASIIILTTIVSITKPELVQAIPIIGSIFKDFKYDVEGNKLKNFEEFSTSVNKTIDNNEVKITIDDIAIDDNIVAITMTIQGDNNDKFINKGIMGAPKLNGESVGYNETDKKIDNNTMETVICGNISEMTLAENIDVELNIVWVGDVKGPWDFKFKTTKNGTSKYSKTIDINKKVSFPTGKLANEFKIEKLVISPFGNTLNYGGTYYEENKDMRNGANDIISYRVTDENGKILNIDNCEECGDKKGYSGKIKILSDLSKTQIITVTPILKEIGDDTEVFNGKECPIYQCSINPKEMNSSSQKLVKKSRETTENEKKKGYAYDTVDYVYRMYNENFVPLDQLVNQEIQLNKETKAIIKSIEATEEKTKITMKVDGNYKDAKIDSVVLFKEGYADTSIEEDGDRAKIEDPEKNIISIELKPVDITKNYKIALPIIKDSVIEDKYSIKIPLK
ncbi:DUF4179 domain-containing protein [Clostridium uliginosum]|uniref:DUF4179 domain-containing protein n=1 Tax=Clostridium uliginosum TaxID=119641 RepID=A0A1I1IF92_9CLOT|nr:DUF4179 domain-containing protein [Clostridium uliginosum]SFC34312.1 protein of unknown function [Clostridium uliginosum]